MAGPTDMTGSTNMTGPATGPDVMVVPAYMMASRLDGYCRYEGFMTL
jgi:hypothetical protein